MYSRSFTSQISIAKQLLHTSRDFNLSTPLARQAPNFTARSRPRISSRFQRSDNIPTPETSDEARHAILSDLSRWTSSPLTTGRFRALGLGNSTQHILREFASFVRTELIDGGAFPKGVWDV